MIKYFTVLTFTFIGLLQFGFAQNNVKLKVVDGTSKETLVGASAMDLKTGEGAISDVNGFIQLTNLMNGDVEIIITFISYQEQIIVLNLPLTDTTTIIINLLPEEELLNEVVITTSKTGARIEETPLKIEVIGTEELNEESSIKPDNVASILGDVSSVQIQNISPVTSEAVIRMQGLPGRYMLLLKDGMPVYSDISSGFSILSIPPLDLKQIEIVKGPASTLNGGGAIAGLVNFVSKEPVDSSETVFMINETTLKETNLNSYFSGKKNKLGFTLFSGYNLQKRIDLNNDFLSDLPDETSFLIHPQIFYYPKPGTKIKLSIAANSSDRFGGDMRVLDNKEDAIHKYFTHVKTNAQAADFLFEYKNKQANILSLKGNVNNFAINDTSSNFHFEGVTLKAYSEIYYAIYKGPQTFIIGANFSYTDFKNLLFDSLQVIENEQNSTVSSFAQYSLHFKNKFSMETGLRIDKPHNETPLLLPSIALLYYLNNNFSIRVNAGTGYNQPNAFTFGEIENDSIYNLINQFAIEKSTGGTLEWNFHKLYSNNLSIFINQSYFYTRINNPVIDYVGPLNDILVQNDNSQITTQGLDNYLRINKEPVEFYFGYTYTLPTQTVVDTIPRLLAYTPIHRMATTILYSHQNFTFGVEAAYNGKQYRSDKSLTPAYTFIAASIKYKVSNLTFVLNGENLLDIKQTDFEPIYTGSLSSPIFKTLWAPVEGRVLNVSVLLSL